MSTRAGLIFGAACFMAGLAVAAWFSALLHDVLAAARPPQRLAPQTPPPGFSPAAAERAGLLAGDIAARVRGTYAEDMALWPPRQEMPR